MGPASRCPCHQGSLGLWVWSRKGPGREHRGSALYCTPKLSVLDLPAAFRFLTVPGRAQLGGSGTGLRSRLQAVDKRRLAAFMRSGLSPHSCQRLVCAPSHQGSTKEGLPVRWLRAPASRGPRGPGLGARGGGGQRPPSMGGVLPNRWAHLKATTSSVACTGLLAQRIWKAGRHATGRFRPPSIAARQSVPPRRGRAAERPARRPLPAPQPLPLRPSVCQLLAATSGQLRAWALCPPPPGARPASAFLEQWETRV